MSPTATAVVAIHLGNEGVNVLAEVTIGVVETVNVPVEAPPLAFGLRIVKVPAPVLTEITGNAPL